MQSFLSNKAAIIINDTVQYNNRVVSSLIGLHALSGCDSVPMMFGIGKAKALDVTKDFQMEYLGRRNYN